MKIFSLESKTVLIGWSLLLGYLFWRISYSVTKRYEYLGDTGFDGGLSGSKGNGMAFVGSDGFPFHTGQFDDFRMYLNLFFWVIVALIILSLIKHIKKQNHQPPSKQS
jgi:hypothetical protein